MYVQYIGYPPIIAC